MCLSIKRKSTANEFNEVNTLVRLEFYEQSFVFHDTLDAMGIALTPSSFTNHIMYTLVLK